MFVNTTQPVSPNAVRLIFEYEGEQVRLVTQKSVEMIITSIDITQRPQPGYYVDTRNATNETLARVPVDNAFETSFEVFPEQHDEPIIRMDVAKPQGAFTVIVPVSDSAVRVVLTQAADDGTSDSSSAAFANEVNDLASFSLESR